ncbi:MAG: thiol peroxidase [Clostridia bacterium]|nr:thiol peroxidase [Clostridia bacterium]MCL6522027.1 thiol peroxidase [Bacillota bacterium]
MAEHTVLFGGKPVQLAGKPVAVGQTAPDATVQDNSLAMRRLSEWSGKVRLIAAVPSLDTPVCDAETRRFNQEAASLGEDVVILTVSMDLPFAQKRWCGAAGVDRVITLSDHVLASFGEAYGTLMPEARLEARAVFVIDRNDRVTYVEYVPEVTQHPDYEAALAAVRRAVAG